MNGILCIVSHQIKIPRILSWYRAFFSQNPSSSLLPPPSSSPLFFLFFSSTLSSPMAGDDASSRSEPKALHPVYSVANIQNKIRILDGVKVTYSAWVKLFKLHARGYRVLDHIDGTAAPAKEAPTYESWAEIDAIVLQWIYGTLSDDLLVRVLDADSTARLAWEKIQNIFISNKSSRAATLEHDFTNTTLSSCLSLDEYCQKLKDLAEQLGDVDHPVTESRLVLQLVRGLPPEFDTVASFINQSSTTWDNARSMLQLEQHRQNARGRGRGRNRGGGRNGGNGGSVGHRGGRSSNGQPQQPPPPGFNMPWGNPAAYQPWAPPPCPYPTQNSPWPAPWNNKPPTGFDSQMANMTTAPNYQPPNGPGPAVDALNPTELGSALNTMHLNVQDPSWYMDTGSSSHLANDSGSQEWKGAFPPQ
ncbi:putative RNA-directed DNA polymerase [Helianthus debilis subsp. tardiflorus]